MKLSDRWNLLLDTHEEREKKERDYLIASWIGKHPLDVVLGMQGVTETNPPNTRSKRKFLAGNIWEDTVKLILQASGAKFAPQSEVYLTEWDLPVKGYCDFDIVGTQEPNTEGLPSYLERMAKELPVEERILEVKSCSTFVMDKLEREDKPIKIHAYQLRVYMKAKGKRGELFYVCKDDCRTKSFLYELIDEEMDNEIKEYISQIKWYIDHKQLPEKAPLILFNENRGRFEKNFDVEYSPYLSLFYGKPWTDEKEPILTRYGEVAFLTPEDYRNYVDPIIRDMNKIFSLVHKEYKTPKAQENQIIKLQELKSLLTSFNFNFTDEYIKSIKQDDSEEEEV